ncbi:MAG: MotA/TolQ/ExbB proton channel family protein, partial [Planctomycetes bacterium]|nr:MotA/TolQ/ExbB proton channel family protein [Planctomycetota bacterium]
MIETLQKGGLTMIPLLFCSVLALAAAIERGWVLLRLRRSIRALAATARAALGEPPGGAGASAPANALPTPAAAAVALARLCKEADNPLARILRKAVLLAGRPYGEIRSAMEEAAGLELPALERRLPILSTISQIATLLGLLGTVFGMIRVFGELSRLTLAGQPVSAGDVAGGISEALIATAGGLCLAIPAVVLYQMLSHLVNGILTEMEAVAVAAGEAVAARPAPLAAPAGAPGTQVRAVARPA